MKPPTTFQKTTGTHLFALIPSVIFGFYFQSSWIACGIFTSFVALDILIFNNKK